MLGSFTDAEDVVQDALLRFHAHDAAEIRSQEAWLTTAVTRLCIDRLRRLGRERTKYPGEWLPEPVAEARLEPQNRAELQDDLSIGFLLLLEHLKPEERAALVLREAFQYQYEELGDILGKRADACRQLVHRAKNRVREARPAGAATREQRRGVVSEFLRALEQGDEQAVLRLVSDDAVWRADGGGKAPATSGVMRGRETLARLAMGFAEKGRGLVEWRIIDLAGEPALAWLHGGAPLAVWVLDVDGERIRAFNNITNPDKLAHCLA
jgi:RNA polymerase sigma-70 factor (ECF subfamily)